MVISLFGSSQLTPSKSSTCSVPTERLETLERFEKARSAQARVGHARGGPRGARYRPSSRHRNDAACAVRHHRCVADARVAPRVRCASRDRPFRRAHALQGHRHAVGRRHRASDRFDRRPARRVHRQGVRGLLHQSPRRALAARRRAPLGHRHAPGVCRGGGRPREEGHPRRNQDGRGHARRPGARALHAAFLGGAFTRTADSWLQGNGRSLYRAVAARGTSGAPMWRRT